MDELGQRLKELRLRQNLKQSELGSKIGVSTSNISRIEKNEISPSANIVLQICNYFDISADWLLSGTTTLDDSIKKDPYQDLSEDEYKILHHYRKLPLKEQFITLGILEEKARQAEFNSDANDNMQSSEPKSVKNKLSSIGEDEATATIEQKIG